MGIFFTLLLFLQSKSTLGDVKLTAFPSLFIDVFYTFESPLILLTVIDIQVELVTMFWWYELLLTSVRLT